MRDRTGIILGLGAFLLILAYPVWQALGSTADPARPALQRSVDPSGCVEDTTYMVARHQELLNTWRTDVVRNGRRFYTATSGREYEMSLTGTCMECHTDSQAFCERCHAYADVTITCWSCHVAPEGL